MNRLALGLAGMFLAVLLAGSGLLYVKGLRADLATVSQERDAARADKAEREETIRRLLVKERENDKARRQLADARRGLLADLDTRETLIRKLENENADLRAWNAVPLPGPVVRLHEHGPITGAAAYRQRMLPRGALPAAGSTGQE